MKARFRVIGKFDIARTQEATVIVERESLLFKVRPLRRRREFVLPLANVAEIVVAKVIKAEVAERRRKKARP